MQHYYIFISFLQLTSNFFADKNVQELLRSNLAKNCEKPGINFLRDDPKINYVSLQMIQYQETMTAPDSGHQHTKKEIFIISTQRKKFLIVKFCKNNTFCKIL